MDLHLKNKVVFVSASGQGIGKAIAEIFLSEGAKVLINDSDDKRLKKAYQEFHKRFGDSVDLFYGDVLERENITKAKEQILKKWRRIDIVIPNLGSGNPQNANKLDEGEWQRFFRLNVQGVLSLLNEFLPVMKRQKQGSIVLISSIVGVEATTAPFGYAAAKASLLTLAKNLSRELASFNIRINTVAPGNIYFKNGRWEEIIKTNPAVIKNYIEKDVPLKRFGTPEEIARAVIFLSSPASSFTTGACMVIDGGETKSY
jgi:3-oxoacyl-[acyl-carrier protein] reductase